VRHATPLLESEIGRGAKDWPFNSQGDELFVGFLAALAREFPHYTQSELAAPLSYFERPPPARHSRWARGSLAPVASRGISKQRHLAHGFAKDWLDTAVTIEPNRCPITVASTCCLKGRASSYRTSPNSSTTRVDLLDDGRASGSHERRGGGGRSAGAAAVHLQWHGAVRAPALRFSLVPWSAAANRW